MSSLYNLRKCNIIIDGEMAEGLGAGTPISIEYSSDRITPYTGAKGESAASTTNDYSATLTLTLQHTSPTNKLLDSLDAKKFPVIFVDANDEGSVNANCVDCMIQTYATNERGTEITEREWTIFIPELRYKK